MHGVSLDMCWQILLNRWQTLASAQVESEYGMSRELLECNIYAAASRFFVSDWETCRAVFFLFLCKELRSCRAASCSMPDKAGRMPSV